MDEEEYDDLVHEQLNPDGTDNELVNLMYKMSGSQLKKQRSFKRQITNPDRKRDVKDDLEEDLELIEELKLTKSMLQNGQLICQGDDDINDFVNKVRTNRKSIQND